MSIMFYLFTHFPHYHQLNWRRTLLCNWQDLSTDLWANQNHTQVQYIPLSRTPLRPNRLDQFIGKILFAVLSIPVWDFANKHERQLNKEIIQGQAYNYDFATTLILSGVSN